MKNLFLFVVFFFTISGAYAQGCVTLSEPMTLQVQLQSTAIACNGGKSTISSTVTGGTAAYNYNWSNGATTADLTNVSAGTYDVTVSDANACTKVEQIIVTEPTLLTLVCSKTDVTFNGNNDGTASVSASGGTSAYSYLWSNGATTSSLSGLIIGTYSVTVTDANACTSVCSSIVNEPSCALTATTSGTAVTCNGGSNGTATVEASGNVGAITYLWNTGATTASISGLLANTYTVTITESATCKFVATYIVTEPTLLTLVCSKTDVTFNGNSDGTASVSASGGTSAYSYLWSNGATTSSISGLIIGTYSVTVTDANACTSVCSSIVNEPSCVLTATTSGTAVTCNGGSNGTAAVEASGNVGAITYLWSTGATTASISGLSANTYTVTITESATCKFVATYIVTEPTLLTLVCSKTDVTFNGNNDGTASVLASGGTSAYSYLWSNGATTSSISGLIIGTYSVTVTDANACTSVCSSIITQPAPACNLVTGNLSIVLDQKETASLSDDEYVIYANPTGTVLAATYSVSGDITKTGIAYGIATEIGRVLASFSTLNYVITDDGDASCTIGESNYNFSANTCIANVNIAVSCDDSGTPFNPADDTYSIFLDPSGNGIGTTYDVSGDFTANNVSYGSSQLIASGILISSGNKTITVTDGTTSTCQIMNITIDPPAACSSNGVAKLDLVKTVDLAEAKVGDNVTYTIKVRNTGTAISNAIEVLDSLNSSLQFISATPSSDYNSATGIWTVGILPINGEAILTITAKLLSIGVTQNYADIVVGGNNDSDGPINNHDVVCTTVPIELCTGTTFTLNIPSTYTDIQWYKDGLLIAGAITSNLIVSSVGSYTFTSKDSASACPVDGCCPIKVIQGTNCCPAKICLPVKVRRN